MTSSVGATTLEAVELLCARGADTSCTYTPAEYEEHCTERRLLAADTQDGPIARCLVRHGADVNAIYEPVEYMLVLEDLSRVGRRGVGGRAAHQVRRQRGLAIRMRQRL